MNEKEINRRQRRESEPYRINIRVQLEGGYALLRSRAKLSFQDGVSMMRAIKRSVGPESLVAILGEFLPIASVDARFIKQRRNAA